ncbi:uncharacterized protein BDV17DRAFT_292353 [Aspergillus undulatus]|uniref:uncharacterized protein n=1 Tax=Aspergillus undulatus TaxID=1810928 RepID=UPI003CCD55A6
MATSSFRRNKGFQVLNDMEKAITGLLQISQKSASIVRHEHVAAACPLSRLSTQYLSQLQQRPKYHGSGAASHPRQIEAGIKTKNEPPQFLISTHNISQVAHFFGFRERS